MRHGLLQLSASDSAASPAPLDAANLFLSNAGHDLARRYQSKEEQNLPQLPNKMGVDVLSCTSCLTGELKVLRAVKGPLGIAVNVAQFSFLMAGTEHLHAILGTRCVVRHARPPPINKNKFKPKIHVRSDAKP